MTPTHTTVLNECEYLDLLRYVLGKGSDQAPARPGQPMTREIFGLGTYMAIDLRQGFPLLTTKKMSLKFILGELLWFISGSTNNNDLLKQGINIWNEWAQADGYLGPIYGKQWRHWGGEPHPDGVRGHWTGGIDQLAETIAEIQRNPASRRLTISAHNVADLPDMSIEPCHPYFQFNADNGFLDLALYQRSGDLFLGVPYNTASYSALLLMVAKICNLTPRFFHHHLGSAHIYHNHFEQVMEQLSREPNVAPMLFLNPFAGLENGIDDFVLEDFKLIGYNPQPAIKGEVAL